MKKFLLKVLAGVLILGVLLAGYNAAYLRTSYYWMLNGMNKYDDLPEHIDIVNFGASHSACAYNWDGFSEFKGVNMALGSQTLIYDEALFNYFFDHLDENSVVIVDVMFKSLYEREPQETPYDTGITRYYQVLPGKYIYHWNFSDALQYAYIPVLGNRKEAWKHIIAEWLGKEAGVSVRKQWQSDGEIPQLQGEPTQVLTDWEYDAMVAEGARRAASFMAQSGDQEHGEEYEALVRIIERCRENDIEIVLTTVPTLPCNYEGYTEEFMDKFYRDMDELCEKYDLVYLDYTGDERFFQDYRMYLDTDHLNVYGGAYFTKMFFEDNPELFKFGRAE